MRSTNNFRDYGHSPVSLIDSECLIDAIVRKHFVTRDEPTSHQGEITQNYACPQCHAECTELYAEFSISMYQSTVSFSQQDELAEMGLYLVGFRGFDVEHMKSIKDYNQTTSVEDFRRQLYDA